MIICFLNMNCECWCFLIYDISKPPFAQFLYNVDLCFFMWREWAGLRSEEGFRWIYAKTSTTKDVLKKIENHRALIDGYYVQKSIVHFYVPPWYKLLSYDKILFFSFSTIMSLEILLSTENKCTKQWLKTIGKKQVNAPIWGDIILLGVNVLPYAFPSWVTKFWPLHPDM